MFVSRGPHPHPPPPRIDKHATPILFDEKKLCEGKSAEEKMRALRAYRRAKGLCVKCAEKWSRDHICAPTAQLHAIQEVLELFSMEDINDSISVHSESQLFLALSVHAVSGTDGLRTMKLTGSIQGQELLILIDSGSSHTFFSQKIAPTLSGVTSAETPLQVQVANGGKLICSSYISHGVWTMGGFKFSADLKILPLHHYDMIMGMDWLEAFSPMKVHWQFKWMSIPYKGSQIFLQGITDEAPPELFLHISELYQVNVRSPSASTSAPPLHAEITNLLHEFAVVFAPPTELPPPRSCDHMIPLIQGAKPVYVRLYRYPPALKYEIERQVSEMLMKGLIQPSVSAFSSPVLLVRKKDGTWRFCVDYRYLNALTLKSRFPIPIFDELMNELAKTK